MSSIFEDLGLASTFVEVLGDDEKARYSRADGGWSGDLVAIFEDPSMLMDMGGGPATIDRAPRFHFASAELPAGHGQNDTIAFRGAAYRVRAVLPDGRGMTAVHVEPMS